MPHCFYYWLSAKPPILRYTAAREYDIGNALPPTRIYRLPIYFWHRTADDIEHYHLQAKAHRPQDVLHHLINERHVFLELQARGIPATFTNQNALLDERVFTVQPHVEKQFDAVYNARMSPFKRHAFARRIPRLLVIGGMVTEGDTEAYFAQVRRELPHAYFTHAAGNVSMQPAQVAEALNRAMVGLCLSAVEGAMYAATEYLLCGLPVVSTASIGGRDEWFDSKYVRVVRDDPDAIAEAVVDLSSLKLSPQWIRQQTLRRIWEHRRRFLELVQSIWDHELVGGDFAREWYARFFHKMGCWRDATHVMRYLDEDCPCQPNG